MYKDVAIFTNFTNLLLQVDHGLHNPVQVYYFISIFFSFS